VLYDDGHLLWHDWAWPNSYRFELLDEAKVDQVTAKATAAVSSHPAPDDGVLADAPPFQPYALRGAVTAHAPDLTVGDSGQIKLGIGSRLRLRFYEQKRPKWFEGVVTHKDWQFEKVRAGEAIGTLWHKIKFDDGDHWWVDLDVYDAGGDYEFLRTTRVTGSNAGDANQAASACTGKLAPSRGKRKEVVGRQEMVEDQEKQLTAEQAKAQAKAEGLTLLTSSTESGYRGVNRYRGKLRSTIMVAGTRRDLGTFDTAEHAALAYARARKEVRGGVSNVDPEDELIEQGASTSKHTKPMDAMKAALEAEHARQLKEQEMRHEQQIMALERRLKRVRAGEPATSAKRVRLEVAEADDGRMEEAEEQGDGSQQGEEGCAIDQDDDDGYDGDDEEMECGETDEDDLQSASKRLLLLGAAARAACRVQPSDCCEGGAQSAAETEAAKAGLETSSTGFSGVAARHGRFKASIEGGDSRSHSLGYFDTVEEAALAVARATKLSTVEPSWQMAEYGIAEPQRAGSRRSRRK